MFVGQAPGAAEEVHGFAMAGETGFLYADLLKEAGLTRAQVRTTNAIRCRPPKEKEPSPIHIRACRPWLLDEVKTCRPKVIAVMGAIALQSVLEQTSITAVRGRLFKTNFNGMLDYDVQVFCMYMPAMLFRRWEEYPTIITDFQKLGRILREGYTEESLGDYQILTTVDSVREYFEWLKTCPRVSFDLETGGYSFVKDQILCLSVSGYSGTAAVVPFVGRHFRPIWKLADWEQVYDILDDFFASDIPKWAQNGIFDINFLRKAEFRFNLSSFTHDTMLAHHSMQENTAHDLDTLLGQLTNMPLYSHELRRWQKANGKVKNYAEFPEEVLWPYAAADADGTTRCGDIQLHQLRNEWTEKMVNGIPTPIPMSEFFSNLVMPLNRALIDMEFRGIVLDRDFMEVLQRQEKDKELAAIQRCHELLGRQFNLASQQQLAVALFESPPLGLGFPVIKKSSTTGRPSTDVEVLGELQKQCTSLSPTSLQRQFLDSIMSVRKSQKLISTYLQGKDGITGMQKHVMPDGRVHPRFKQHTVVTGRLSTSDPAIHNIPAPTDEAETSGSIVRFLFSAPRLGMLEPITGEPITEPWFMIQADYSQLEMRIIAAISQEETMLEAFRTGRDIHRMIAAEIFNVPYDEVTGDQRSQIKGVNFGLIYGRGPQTLAEEFGWPVERAVKFIKDYFARFPGLQRYFNNMKESVQTHGVGINVFGRKRRLYGYQFFDKDRMTKYSGGNWSFVRQCEARKEEIMRQVINFGIQSAGSDRLSRATAEIHQEYKRRNLKSALIISHHDALYVESPASELMEAAWILMDRMEAPVPELYDFSFKVDMHVGDRWGHHDEVLTKQCAEYIARKREELLKVA